MMKTYIKRFVTLYMITIMGGFCAWGQEMPVTASDKGRELFNKARQVHQEAWFEKADDLFREAVAADSGIAVAYAYAGVLDYLLYRDPAANISKARELAKNLQGGERRMVDALVLYAERDYDGAETALKDVLEEFPGDPYARHRLGAAQVSAGRPGEGVETLRALLRDRPDYPGAWNHLGYGLLALEQTDEALDAFRNFMAASPGNPSAHHSYAEALAKSGEIDAAIGHLTRAVLIEPRFAYGWLHMGIIFLQEGAVTEARGAFEMAEQAGALYGAEFRDAVKRRLAETNPQSP